MGERLKKWWRGFVRKQKLAVTDSDDGSEKWYMYISPARIVVGLVSLVLILFVAVALMMAYTRLADTIPGYPGRRSREALVAGLMRLDSLQRRMADLTIYSDNIALIMEGKTPVIRDVTRVGDSIQRQDKTAVARSGADSVLRARMEGLGPYSLAASSATPRPGATSGDLVPPAHGLVQSHFSPVAGRFGIEIVTSAGEPVVAVRDGTVISSVWSPGEGYVVQIQHRGDLVSLYRRISQVQTSVGARVRGGEIIGTAGTVAGSGAASEGTSGPLGFELWYNGTPVDPENQIGF